MKSFKYFIITITLLLLVLTGTKTTSVQANTNTTLAKATTISIGSTTNGTFKGDFEEVHYYKLTIPKDIGNQYIIVSLTNYADSSIRFNVKNKMNQNLLSSDYISINDSDWLRCRTNTDATSGNMTLLSAGNTYYITIEGLSSHTKGNYSLYIESQTDDNWGTFEKAKALTVNQIQAGQIEYWDDIDCYYITLPKDKRKYTFIISADDKAYALFANSNRQKIGDTNISANSTDSSYTVTGNGQKIFVRMEADNNSTKYTIKVVAQKLTISKLSLTKYKKGSKKIVGKTIKNATVKVTINKKSYTVQSNKKGKFSVKLKKKLKSKQKIKISVSKKNYKNKKKTFKVK